MPGLFNVQNALAALAVCEAVGVPEQTGEALEPGEVRIRSAAAGTEIVLHNNGRIDINGVLFINGMPYLPLGG